MKLASYQPSQSRDNPTIILQCEQNLTEFINVLLIKLSDMLHSSKFVKLFHHQSFTLYGILGGRL